MSRLITLLENTPAAQRAARALPASLRAAASVILSVVLVVVVLPDRPAAA